MKEEYGGSPDTAELICFDSEGNAYFATLEAIQKYSPSLKYISPFINRAKGLNPSDLCEFHSYSFDTSGNLIACDRLNHSIRIYDKDGKIAKQVNLDRYPNQVFINKQGDIFLELNNIKGECRFEKVDGNFNPMKCLMKESGKSILKGFVLRAFCADFDGQGNAYFIDGVEYKVNVFDRDGKNIRTIGKPGAKYSSMEGEAPYPVESNDEKIKFDKWWDSWSAVSDIYVMKNKFLLVFFRCNRKMPDVSLMFLDIYTLDGKKIESDIAVPKSLKPIGRDDNGNLYFTRFEYKGSTVKESSYGYLTGAKLLRYSLVLK